MKILLVGSGLSSYGACLALLEKKKKNNLEIEVIDIGLEKSSKFTNEYLVPNSKDYEGSFFPYGVNDLNSTIKLDSQRVCSSHAFGGYSKVYSGSILRPKNFELVNWPKDAIPISEDYEKILSSLDFKYRKNEVADFFLSNEIDENNSENVSLLGDSLISKVNVNYKNGNKKSIPFDSSFKFNEWIKDKKIKYFNESYLIKIEVKENFLIAFIKQKNKLIKKKYNKIFLGAGCVNTTAIVDRSIFSIGSRDYLIKSCPSLLQLYFKLPFRDKLDQDLNLENDNYILCKYFLEHKSNLTSGYWSHTQIGPINRVIKKKLKDNTFKFIYSFIDKILNMFFFSTTVFHSETGMEILLKSEINCKSNLEKKEQNIRIIEKTNNLKIIYSFAIKFAVLKRFFNLFLLPIPFSNFLANKLKGNKLGGWHYGGTLPFSNKNQKKPYCKPSGEVAGLKNVFVIDASSFPSIPGSTVALLTMANAYRIAKKCFN